MPRKALDLTGRYFGDIEVIERHGSTSKGAAVWRCLCHRCEKEFLIEGQRLTDKSNPKKNCGCEKREREKDLTGGVYGALTVLTQAERWKDGSKAYLCRCGKCGKEKIFPASTIRTCPKGCGCLQFASEKMKKISDSGVKAKFDKVENGKLADIAAIKSDKAMANSKTGVRGVFPERKTSGTYRVAVQVAVERLVKTGFTSIESAKAAYDEMKKGLIKKHRLDQGDA